MFTLIEAETEILKAQNKLEKTIRKNFTKKLIRNVGYPGGTTYDTEVYTDAQYWYSSSELNNSDTPNPRLLNWFGVFSEEDLQISVEINIPFKGRNDQVAGFFAKNTDNDLIYLMHSGRVGGGTTGVGKSSFLAWSNQKPISVVDSNGTIKEGLLVMPIEGNLCIKSSINYINRINNFKKSVRSGELSSQEFKLRKEEFDSFYSEARGIRKKSKSNETEYLSRHGEIVDVLNAWRISIKIPEYHHIVKNIFIDLGVEAGGKLIEVYEVKTSSSRSDIYKAIGQLFVHSTNVSCEKFIVLPKENKLLNDLEAALVRLEIKILRFEISNNNKITILAS